MPPFNPRVSARAAAFTLFGLDKAALTLALVTAKLWGLIDISWALATAPLWAGWLLLWPLGRLTGEVLSLARVRRSG